MAAGGCGAYPGYGQGGPPAGYGVAPYGVAPPGYGGPPPGYGAGGFAPAYGYDGYGKGCPGYGYDAWCKGGPGYDAWAKGYGYDAYAKGGFPGYDAYGKGYDAYCKGGFDAWSKGGPAGYDAYGKGAPPGYDGACKGGPQCGKGGCAPAAAPQHVAPRVLPPRERSRSPLRDAVKDTNIAPQEAQPGKPLDRYEGAQRDNRPAWMTKGVGVGTQMFGEATGDLAKPGLTFSDLEKLKQKTVDESVADPFADVFAERPAPPTLAANTPRAPLPGQAQLAGTAANTSRAPLPDQASAFSSSNPNSGPVVVSAIRPGLVRPPGSGVMARPGANQVPVQNPQPVRPRPAMQPGMQPPAQNGQMSYPPPQTAPGYPPAQPVAMTPVSGIGQPPPLR